MDAYLSVSAKHVRKLIVKGHYLAITKSFDHSAYTSYFLIFPSKCIDFTLAAGLPGHSPPKSRFLAILREDIG